MYEEIAVTQHRGLDRALWTGRIDTEDGGAGRRWHQVIEPVADTPGTALIGLASDAGVTRNRGRAGAAEGPAALRRMLANLAWHGGDRRRLYDAGDIVCEGDVLEDAQSAYARHAAALLRDGHFPIGLGGGHEIAWASYSAIAQAFAGDARLERLGIVNFDAHLDLREPAEAGRGSSGTPFLQIARARRSARLPFRYLCIGASAAANTPALLERAARLDVEIVQDVHVDEPAAEQVLSRFVAGSSSVYLTFCLDALPAAVAPGVSAPAALGIAPQRALRLLRRVLEECAHGRPDSRLLMADVAELNPRCDREGRTARIAARLVHEIAAIR
jgi:formiminoglutamase